jgi:oxygen-independent coproporphyrinogen-3 oxidase
VTGLYLHTPFCSALCHYCDFAKTANRSGDVEKRWFLWLRAELTRWLELWVIPQNVRFSSVFLGGGTPGLYGADEWGPVFELLRPLTRPGAEITIEANPSNVTHQKIAEWHSLGINRLSIGVQTFDPAGLAALTRDHDPSLALRAVDNALASPLKNVNVDLIFGWKGQTAESWRRDLASLTSLRVPHISLYALTVEGRTPLAMRARRGMSVSEDDDVLAERWLEACETLQKGGWEHEEVSNWSLPGASCQHNWLYWGGGQWLGIGPGAHSWLDPLGDGIGVRFNYPRSERALMRDRPPLEIDRERDKRAVILEVISCGLRTCRGFDLEGLLSRFGARFVPVPRVARALEDGVLLERAGRLCLDRREWFREASWVLDVWDSIQD